jgi:Spy/CpxP family protein refolding chaperone
MSKKMFLVLVCALFLVFTGAQSMAQNTPDQAASQAANAAPQAKDDAAQALGDPETKAKVQEEMQELVAELDLTNEQQKQLKPILQDEFKQLKAVNDDTSLPPDQKKTKITEIRENAKSQINSILTPDQQKKLGEMKEKAKENLDK